MCLCLHACVSVPEVLFCYIYMYSRHSTTKSHVYIYCFISIFLFVILVHSSLLPLRIRNNSESNVFMFDSLLSSFPQITLFLIAKMIFQTNHSLHCHYDDDAVFFYDSNLTYADACTSFRQT